LCKEMLIRISDTFLADFDWAMALMEVLTLPRSSARGKKPPCGHSRRSRVYRDTPRSPRVDGRLSLCRQPAQHFPQSAAPGNTERLPSLEFAGSARSSGLSTLLSHRRQISKNRAQS
jgi:hypothetical protein